MTAFRIGPKLDKDDPFAPVEPGYLWVHGAAPGDHKTNLLHNLVYDAGVNQGMVVLYVSPELSYDKIRRRLHARHAMHPTFGLSEQEAIECGTLLRRGENVTQADLDRIAPIRADLASGRFGTIHVEEAHDIAESNQMGELAAFVRRQPFKPAVVFIDSFPMLCKAKRLDGQVRQLRKATDDMGCMVFATFNINRRAMFNALNAGGHKLSDLVAQGRDIVQVPDHYTTALATPELREQSRVRFQHHVTRHVDPGPAFDMRFIPGVGAFVPLS